MDFGLGSAPCAASAPLQGPSVRSSSPGEPLSGSQARQQLGRPLLARACVLRSVAAGQRLAAQIVSSGCFGAAPARRRRAWRLLPGPSGGAAERRLPPRGEDCSLLSLTLAPACHLTWDLPRQAMRPEPTDPDDGAGGARLNAARRSDAGVTRVRSASGVGLNNTRKAGERKGEVPKGGGWLRCLAQAHGAAALLPSTESQPERAAWVLSCHWSRRMTKGLESVATTTELTSHSTFDR